MVYLDINISKQPAIVKGACALIIFSAALYSISKNFLMFHLAIEFICALIVFSILSVALESYSIFRKNIIMFIGIAYGFIGLFTVLHALVYSGYAIFKDSKNAAIQFSLASLYIECLSLFAIPKLRFKNIDIKSILCIYAASSIIIMLGIFSPSLFPACYIEGKGLMPFSSISYFVAVMLLVANLIIIFKNHKDIPSHVYDNLVPYIMCSTLSKVLLLALGSTNEITLALVHILKSISYLFMYNLMVNAGIIIPYNSFYNKSKELETRNLNLMQENAKQKELQEELWVQKAYFKELFENSPEGIVIINNNGLVIDINKGFQDIFQYSIEEIKGLPLDDFIVPDNLEITAKEYVSTIFEKKSVEVETVRRKKDGNLIDVSILGYAIEDEGRQIGIIAIYKDISEHKKAEEEIRYLTFHDKLTDLYNRTFFDEELVRLNSGRQLPLSIIMGDVNNLKLANDIFGHAEGDRLLIGIADIIKKCCRREDVIARWGGDEFLILLPKTNEQTAEDICRRIKRCCLEAKGYPVQPSIALGTSTKLKPSQSIDKVLREAECRMYKNKLIEHKDTRHTIMASLERSIQEKKYKTLEQTKYLKELAITTDKAYKFTKILSKKP